MYISHMGTTYQIRDQEALYFFTFQVVGWADIFTRKVYRDTIIDSFKYCTDKKHMILCAYVIMSNHVHAIIKSDEGNLSGLIRDFKKHTSKHILSDIAANPRESRKEWLEMIFRYHAKFNNRVAKRQLWTHENHAVELSTNEMIDSRVNYIHQNPVRAGIVKEAEHYVYSSASNYADMDGLIDVEVI